MSAAKPVTGFGARLRKAREAKGLTQKQLAEKLERSHTRIAEMERSETCDSFSVGTLRPLAKALGVKLFWLIGN